MELRRYGVQTTIYFPLIDKDATDFESTPVTFAAGDVQVSKDGGAFANVSNSVAHEGNGIYSLVITATEMQAKQVVVTLIDQTATKEWEDQAIVITTIANASAEIPKIGGFDENDIADQVWDETAGDHTAAGSTGKELQDKLDDATYSAAPSAADVADAVWDEAVAGHQTNSTFGKAFADATTPELAAVASAAQNAIADALLKRDLDQVEASAPVHSPASAFLKLVSRFVASTGKTYRTDGSTVHMTQTPTTDDSASPTVELGAAA